MYQSFGYGRWYCILFTQFQIILITPPTTTEEDLKKKIKENENAEGIFFGYVAMDTLSPPPFSHPQK